MLATETNTEHPRMTASQFGTKQPQWVEQSVHETEEEVDHTWAVESGCENDDLAVKWDELSMEEAEDAEWETTPRIGLRVRADSRSDSNCTSGHESTYETEIEDEYDQPNWKQLYKRGIEKRERMMLDEYSTVLKSFSNMQNELSDVEKRNQNGFYELALMLKEIKTSITSRDDVESSHKQGIQEHNSGANVTNYKHYPVEESPVSIMQPPSFPASSNISSVCSPISMKEHVKLNLPMVCPPVSMKEHGETSGRKYATRDFKNEDKCRSFGSPRTISPFEKKLRADIDKLLEENLEFWLTFNNLHLQLRKHETSVDYLRVELSGMKAKKNYGKKKSKYLNSEAQPIYNHLREVHSKLTIWLKKASVSRSKLHDKYGSLCSTQETLAKVAETSLGEDGELCKHYAVKFQRELHSLRHDNSKISIDLQSGMDIASGLKVEVEDMLAKLREQLKIKSTKSKSSCQAGNPLRFFWFGVRSKNRKPQKSWLLACQNPTQ